MNIQEMETKDSESDSSSDEDITSECESNKKKISLSPELILLKDVLRVEIRMELDKSIEYKLEPLQTSLNSLVAKSSQCTLHQDTPQNIHEHLSMKIQGMKMERANKELKSRIKHLEKTTLCLLA